MGGKYQVHVDSRVQGISGIVSGSGDRLCGFWISSISGNVFETFQGHRIPGCLIDVGQRPLLFHARTPHCSKHLGGPSESRISITAFCPLRAHTLSLAVLETIRDLGFPLVVPVSPVQTSLKSFFPMKRRQSCQDIPDALASDISPSERSQDNEEGTKHPTDEPFEDRGDDTNRVLRYRRSEVVTLE